MKLNKLHLKARQGVRIIRNEGFLSFGIRALQILQKKKVLDIPKAKNPIYTQVKYADAIAADLSRPLPIWPGTDKKQLTFNWVMPPPGKGSGGHKVIFKAIEYLEKSGHTCRIYYYGVFGNSPIADIRASMGDSYPNVNATMKWIDSAHDMEPADGLVATSWETAYPVFNSDQCAKRFYFVLDFEPYFYPVGGLYALAENTYKFGLHCLTGGKWIATKLKRDYDIQADYFDFSSDEAIYKYINTAPRKEILYYCRPYTARRGFEVAIMALDLFHKKHPEYIINLFGHDVSEYDIPFPYNNLKTLELDELNELYNRCSAGLVMSFTNMSLLPPELLACGVIPVVNTGENNSLVSNNPYIAYADATPMALANKLSEVICRKDLKEYAKNAAKSVHGHNWNQSGEQIVAIFEKNVRNPDITL